MEFRSISKIGPVPYPLFLRKKNMLDNEQDIAAFLVLQQKTDQELQIIAKNFQLPVNLSRIEIIKALQASKPEPQLDFKQPQVVPLRTTKNGVPIPGATEFLKKCRAVIFNGKTNTKEFKLLNSKGELYSLKMKYARCSNNALKRILDQEYYFTHNMQKELLKEIKENPEIFDIHVVNKPRQAGGTFIMLHVSRKT